MLIRLCCFSLLLGLFACGGPADADSATTGTDTTATAPATNPTDGATNFTIIPDQAVGDINANTGPDELRKIFGAENVRDTDVYVGEGMSQPGAVIFPDSPNAIEVVWTMEGEKRPELVYIREDQTKWATAQGVTIGTPLATLQQLNGKPFNLMGFGWDYGGTVTDWNGGKLEGLNLRLSYPEDQEVGTELLGDRPVSSDAAGLQNIGAFVDEIYVVLNRPTQ